MVLYLSDTHHRTWPLLIFEYINYHRGILQKEGNFPQHSLTSENSIYLGVCMFIHCDLLWRKMLWCKNSTIIIHTWLKSSVVMYEWNAVLIINGMFNLKYLATRQSKHIVQWSSNYLFDYLFMSSCLSFLINDEILCCFIID